ncbi:hypothetical protein PF005_g25281 [Phytophthora fragariae]|nr:hypothetical protein PF009_g26306 [Phytophthora fragariae]KAE9073788.1 hypothetical protein PF007_g25669 [Phytophthora fragariae]KAE9091344.1 hypothetical protein PF006_g24948 [Phytophthora fragariae]KAE9175709.1 hypothetical protein PF005_g25281 [Phytophthora fragariae]KAE9185084.1 hypothetical protein PF004_g23476 [Phytophthora fragariae]
MRYFALFVDEASRFSTLFLMKDRTDVYAKFQFYYERVKTNAVRCPESSGY